MSARVYIPNLPTRFDVATGGRIPSLDLNPAAKYGTLINCTEGPVSAEKLNYALEIIRIEMKQMIKEDYILCVGDVVLTAAAISYANQANGSVRLLRWDKNRHSYDVSEVSL